MICNLIKIRINSAYFTFLSLYKYYRLYVRTFVNFTYIALFTHL